MAVAMTTTSQAQKLSCWTIQDLQPDGLYKYVARSRGLWTNTLNIIQSASKSSGHLPIPVRPNISHIGTPMLYVECDARGLRSTQTHVS